jgi:hypothetical protein
VHECAAAGADRHALGRFMGGHGSAEEAAGRSGAKSAGLREAA